MVAYNFQALFASDVESGRKCQTIRAEGRRRHADVGEFVQLYTGQRTRACRKLGDGICTGSSSCRITESGVDVAGFPIAATDGFARNDGFRDFEHMKQWFRNTHGLPFTGRLIRWERRP